VLSVSAAMSIITIYCGEAKHTVQPTGWLHDRTDQALATMQRFRTRFDVALGNLSILEVEDTVSVGDVVSVVQAAEMLLRIAEEVDSYVAELGDDGRLVGLQSAELMDGVAEALHLVVRDYCVLDAGEDADRPAALARMVDELAGLPSDDLRDSLRVARVLRLPGSLHDVDSATEPRGYRLLSRLPRFSDTIIERIVGRFSGLQQIMRASVSELEQVEGVGPTRANSIKDGLSRLAEASIFERYQ
jgi:diadenylate cyclase